MSLNPVLPIITRYFRISVPLIEGLYMLFIITYSFYWKLNSEDLDALSERQIILSSIHFVFCWALLAFPLLSLILGIIFFLIFGIPLLIYEKTRKRPLEDLAQPEQRAKIIIESYRDAKRYRVSADTDKKVDMCSICLANIKEKEIVVALRCHEAHIFHERCLKQWTQT